MAELSDEISFSNEFNGEELTEEQKFILKIAAELHDVGHGMAEKGSHAAVSADYVRNNNDLPLDSAQREKVAKICELHSKTETKKKYGSADLQKLVENKKITKEEAYLASLLRVADAADCDQERVRKNSRGENFDKIVKQIKSSQQSHHHLKHLYGHKGIEKISVEKKQKKLVYRFKLSPDIMESKNGANIAFKIIDLVKDANSTYFRGKYKVELSSKNKKALKNWYEKNKIMLEREISKNDIELDSDGDD